MKSSEMNTPDLLVEAAKVLRGIARDDIADELDIRSARLGNLEYQAGPGHNDLTGQAPAQIMATVNAPSPAGA